MSAISDQLQQGLGYLEDLSGNQTLVWKTVTYACLETSESEALGLDVGGLVPNNRTIRFIRKNALSDASLMKGQTVTSGGQIFRVDSIVDLPGSWKLILVDPNQ